LEKKIAKLPICEMATVSDEAFTLLLLENYWEGWSTKNLDEYKKLSFLSVISLRLLRTKKTHTGAVLTGLPRRVEDHHFAELVLGQKCIYQWCGVALVALQLSVADCSTYSLG